MHKITLPYDLNGMRYGIEFFRGVGQTDDERIIGVLKKKGLNVEPVNRFEQQIESDAEPEKPRRGRPPAQEE